MFDKEYSFRGTHAEKVSKLTANFDSMGNKLFARNYDVYLIAPIIGFLYGVKSSIDKEGTKETTKIFAEVLMKNKDDLLFNYRLVMILDKSNAPSIDERVNKAFRYYGDERANGDEDLYDHYVLGGVDKLYEKLIETAKNSEDYLRNLYYFMEEVDERYNQAISTDSIIDLCRLAKS